MTSMPSDWLNALSNAVSECLLPAAAPSPIGAHVQTATDDAGRELSEVSLFYGATEVVGGSNDGQRSETPFWLDLAGLRAVFDRVDEFTWQASPLGPEDDLGPHIAIEGEFEGRPVRLRMLSRSPAQFPAARTADARRGVLVEQW